MDTVKTIILTCDLSEVKGGAERPIVGKRDVPLEGLSDDRRAKVHRCLVYCQLRAARMRKVSIMVSTGEERFLNLYNYYFVSNWNN